MEVVLLGIPGKIAEYTVASISHQFGYLIKYSSNIDSLRAQVDKLKGVQDGVQGLVAAAERNGHVIRPDVQIWLTEANKITAESDNFLRDEVNLNQRFSFSSCPNLILRFKVSRKANKNKLAVDELLCDTPPDDDIMSRESTINEIIEVLKDDRTNIIGVYGMGGVGKTTLLKDVAKQLKQLFDEIVMTEVSQTPSIKKIQDDIASILGLRLEERDSLLIRAGRLRERIKASKRILVILDDLWYRLDLEEIGLPQVDAHKGCKIVLTTRNQQVCVEMRTQVDFPIRNLSESEEWDLFKTIAGDIVDSSSDLKLVATKVAKECAGLPLCIETVAGALMNVEDLSVWKDALLRLQNPAADIITITSAKVYSSLKLSYDFLDVEEAKHCFLLCCLADEDSDMGIKNLVQFGIGIGIFDNRCTLLEIRDRVHASVNKLKDRRLLLNGKYEDCVRMHDVVRDFAISIVSGSHHRSWARIDIGRTDLSALNNELEILLLKGEYFSSVIPDNLFERKKDLRVLSMHNMNPKLPTSVQDLVNLRTLCLEDCCVQDLSFIGKLKCLEVLSFVHCDIQELPREIEQLKQLRVLELSMCVDLKVIPAGVLSSLSRLEGLYMYRSSVDWGKNGNASLDELNGLCYLSSIDMYLPAGVKLFPKDLDLVNLSAFKISFGTEFHSNEWKDSLFSDPFDHSAEERWFMCSKRTTLKLGNSHQSIASHDGVKMLVNKAESLIIENLEEGLEYFMSELDNDGFARLKCLKVSENKKIEYLGNAMNEEIPQFRILFPVLEELQLKKMQNLREICRGGLPSESFCELCELMLDDLPNLENLWGRNTSLPNLRGLKIKRCGSMKNLFSQNIASGFGRQLSSLQVEECQNLEEIFTYDVNGEELAAEEDEIVLSKFKILRLSNLPNLSTFCSKKSNQILGPVQKALFSEKIAFPNLEELEVNGKFEEIWPHKIPGNSFCRLRVMGIDGFHKIKIAIPSNLVHKLQNLEQLSVTDCDGVEGVVEELPKLKHMVWKNDFPTKLNSICWGLGRPSQARDLNQLKEIDISHSGMMNELDNLQVGNGSLPNLRVVKIKRCGSMKNLFSQNIASGFGCLLSSLEVEKCPNLEEIFTYDVNASTTAEDKIVLCKFKILRLSSLPKLTTFCSKRGNHISSPIQNALLSEKIEYPNLEELNVCGKFEEIWPQKIVGDSFCRLRVLEIYGFHEIKTAIPSDLVRRLENLEQLSVAACGSLEEVVEEVPKLKDNDWKPHKLNKISILLCGGLRHLFSASQARYLNQLKEIDIYDCRMMKEIIMVGNTKELGEEDNTGDMKIVLPQLETITLNDLEKLTCFCSGNCTLELPLLKELRITGSPKLDTLFGGSESCEVKESQKASSSKYAANWTKGINREEDDGVIQSLFNEKVRLPTLETLRIIGLKFLKEIWYNQKLPVDSFCQLSFLSIRVCDCLRYILTPSIVKSLLRLNRIRISWCLILEVVVAEEDQRQEICMTEEEKRIMVFPQLRSLCIDEVPELKCFYQGHCTLEFSSLAELEFRNCPKMKTMASTSGYECTESKKSFDHDTLMQGLFNEKVLLPNLKKLKVTGCDSLSNLLTPSVVEALSCLEELSVKHCPFLEQVIIKEEEEEEERTQVCDKDKVLVFPKLHKMELIDLPNLKSFYPGNLTLEFSSLKEVYMSDCPQMQAFSSGCVVTPQNPKVIENTKVITDHSGEGDLNSTTQYLFKKKGEEDERKEKDEEENACSSNLSEMSEEDE